MYRMDGKPPEPFSAILNVTCSPKRGTQRGGVILGHLVCFV